MLIRKLLGSWKSSTFGVETIIRRTKTNHWGTYGYNNFGHNKPDHFPPITKAFHLFVGLGLVLPMLDWDTYWPIIVKKFYATKKRLGMEVPPEVENPPPRENKLAQFRLQRRNRTMRMPDDPDS